MLPRETGDACDVAYVESDVLGGLMDMNKISILSWCAALFLSLPVNAGAQAVGTLSGTVLDSAGAAIPMARIEIIESGTSASRLSETSKEGSFQVPNLPVGKYTVKVEAPGFGPKTISDLSLDVSQKRVLEITLSIASSSETAEVTAAPPTLNTSDGSLAGLVTEEQVVDMPLNGRSIQNLVMFQPGMAPDSGSMGWLAPQWISDGNRGETEVATLDGADASDYEMGTVEFWNFNLDGIQEFKVQQANYSAEFGQGGGSVTQIVTKSGTNGLHGSAYEFVRNTVFDTRNYFSTSVPPFQRNEFGATIGGPIVRDRTFFFGQYAGLRQRLGSQR